MRLAGRTRVPDRLHLQEHLAAVAPAARPWASPAPAPSRARSNATCSAALAVFPGSSWTPPSGGMSPAPCRLGKRRTGVASRRRASRRLLALGYTHSWSHPPCLPHPPHPAASAARQHVPLAPGGTFRSSPRTPQQALHAGARSARVRPYPIPRRQRRGARRLRATRGRGGGGKDASLRSKRSRPSSLTKLAKVPKSTILHLAKVVVLCRS